MLVGQLLVVVVAVKFEKCMETYQKKDVFTNES